MDLKKAFALYQGTDSDSNIQAICLSLRRNGITTLEQLQCIYRKSPEQIQKIRNIGPLRMALIDEILQFFQETGLMMDL